MAYFSPRDGGAGVKQTGNSRRVRKSTPEKILLSPRREFAQTFFFLDTISVLKVAFSNSSVPTVHSAMRNPVLTRDKESLQR